MSTTTNSPLRYQYYGFTFDLPFEKVPVGVESLGNLYYIHLKEGDPLEVKACHKCKRLLPVVDFYKQVSPCKCCHKAVVRRYEKSHEEKVKLWKKKSNRAYRLKRTPNAYNNKRTANREKETSISDGSKSSNSFEG